MRMLGLTNLISLSFPSSHHYHNNPQSSFFNPPPRKPLPLFVAAAASNNNNNNNGVKESQQQQQPSSSSGSNSSNGQEEQQRKPSSYFFGLNWSNLLDPDPDNLLALGLTGLLTWASVQVLFQLLFISLAILVAALKYSFIAALLIFILIALL
ncbi:uncharacterized protein LOC123924736 [Trifolium pratense]|uniref:uncharacterized protein LOC123924736 n=1 Tax=Trifolium pratense TaxID=57577 RepID=UPI001E693CD0|nr:uncharacterized protein LOC123924736 [Trifolium pratense]